MTVAPIEDWPARLEQVVADGCSLFRSVVVLRETTSTQEAARRAGARGGEVFTAWRQTAGRGRLGRSWADTGEYGVAATFALNRHDMEFDERLAIAAAVGTAGAIEAAAGARTGIKWPNDIVIGGRKVAGVLIETEGDVALIGIGINVAQSDWPEDLRESAVSLRQIGHDLDRLDMTAALVVAIDATLRTDTVSTTNAFVQRDVLVGTEQAFRQGDRIIRGRVERVEPLRGLIVREHDGRETWLRAATTTMQVGDQTDR